MERRGSRSTDPLPNQQHVRHLPTSLPHLKELLLLLQRLSFQRTHSRPPKRLKKKDGKNAVISRGWKSTDLQLDYQHIGRLQDLHLLPRPRELLALLAAVLVAPVQGLGGDERLEGGGDAVGGRADVQAQVHEDVPLIGLRTTAQALHLRFMT